MQSRKVIVSEVPIKLYRSQFSNETQKWSQNISLDEQCVRNRTTLLCIDISCKFLVQYAVYALSDLACLILLEQLGLHLLRVNYLKRVRTSNFENIFEQIFQQFNIRSSFLVQPLNVTSESGHSELFSNPENPVLNNSWDISKYSCS